ncbi:OmpH family outer membrane protein [Sphingobium sufflavum]|uniref:OmpH family outer membrane protein n=1 Tax=Sphingobium sufflavum TaxID=1129547 RepID=UPI001F308FE9|nr:OmpH family outer membrane protein [Sphingobium sufflavum]MCE7798329.1 OmpH family outer membrane protein [Sphingobium sufflavum]
MRNSFKHIALALPIGAAMMVAAPAMAQSKLGIAVADVEAAVANSNAYTVARGQMNTTYKAQIDQFNARKAALETDLKTKQDALNAAAKAAGTSPTPAVRTQLQGQYEALQTAQQNAQAELQRIGQPVALAQAYVEEQIAAKLNDALKGAMTAAKVDLVLKPDSAVSFQPSVDITAQVKAQLDTLVPSASIVPPAGWRPGGQSAAAPAAAAPASPAAKPTGR